MSLKQWVAGEELTASDLNGRFRDNISLVAGEAILAGQPVIIGDDTGTAEEILQDNEDESTNKTMNGTEDHLAQSFTINANGEIKLISFSFYLGKAGASSTILTSLSIYLADGAGEPTGSALATKAKTIAVSYGPQWTTYTLDTVLDLDVSTKYVAVISGSSYDAESLGVNFYSASNSYAGGEGNISADGGSTYSAFNYDFRFKANFYNDWTDVGKAYLADASVNNSKANNFIGFADDDILITASGLIKLNGYDNNQTGLTVGVPYYLSNTRGAISSSAGSQSRLIGRSLSATEVEIVKTINVTP